MKTIREQRRVPAMPALNSLGNSEPWWWWEAVAAAAGRNVKQNECQITAASSEGKVIRTRAREVKNELIESTRLSGEAESEGCRR